MLFGPRISIRLISTKPLPTFQLTLSSVTTNNSNDIAFMPRRLRSTVRGPCILPVFIRSAAVSWRFTTSLARGSEADTAKKDELVVDHQEYSKSGYDGWAAQTTETAFGTERTAPDEQLMHAEIESEKVRPLSTTNISSSTLNCLARGQQRGLQSNPLEISPAKEELSQTREKQRDIREKSESLVQESKRSYPPKGITTKPCEGKQRALLSETEMARGRRLEEEQTSPRFPQRRG